MAIKVQCATCQATYSLAKPPLKKTVAICKKCGEEIAIEPSVEVNKAFQSGSSAVNPDEKLNVQESGKGSARVNDPQVSEDQSKKKVKKGGFFSRASKGIVSEKEISRDWRKTLGICFAILAIISGSLWYVRSGTGTFVQIMIWPFGAEWVDHTFATRLKFRFPPGLINSLWGLGLCFPIYLREFIPFKKLSPYSYISFVLNYLLFSVIAQLLFGASGSFTFNIMTTAFLASLLISWIGMRSVAGFGWIIVFLLAMINLIGADHHLKQFGSLFLICAFSSLIFQTNLSAKDFFRKFIVEFRGLEEGSGTFVKDAMADAAQVTGDALKSGIKASTKIAIG